MGTRVDPKIPIELREAYEGGELIICVGPDLGRRAGLPDASQFALALLADAESFGLEIDAPTLREWIARGRIMESLEVLERRMGTRFQRVAEREFADRGRPLPPLARAIASLSGLRAVYTTGIDRLLERAFADAWPSFTSPRPDIARRSRLIFKLCGTLEFPDTWVLTQAAYEREFGERSLRRQLLLAALRAHCLLFVGFDPAKAMTRRLLSIVDTDSREAQLPSHFVALEHCGLEARTLLERRGLHVIVGDSVATIRALAGDDEAQSTARGAQLPPCPYPGLHAFDDSLAEVFHGRRAEISLAAARLGGPKANHRRWLAVDGSSGVGKTSFVHAGLIPALRRGFAEATPARWLVSSMRPGRHPLRALVHALGAVMEHDPSPLTAAFDELGQTKEAALDPAITAAAVASFVRERARDGVALLVVVDQLEEVVTLAGAGERERFAACLVLLLKQQLIYLITTLRSDFNAALAGASPALARLLNDQAERYTLAPISRVGLRLAIAEPAAQLGVEFEAELVERIASDAEQHRNTPGDADGVVAAEGVVRTDDAALPLVAHVLRGLWDLRSTRDGPISFTEYRALGGVSGALSRNADMLLAGLSNKQLARVKALLLRMASFDGGHLARRTLTRVEALALAGGDDEGQRLLTLLSGGDGPRLLVVRGEHEDAVVDLVHEALLREWDTLRGWLAANRSQLARDEALAMRAAAWAGRGRPWRSLPRGPERRELMRARPHGHEAGQHREFQRAMRRATWLRGGGWVSFVAGLAAIAALVVLELEDAKSRDERRRLESSELQDELDTKEYELAEKQRDDAQSEIRRGIDARSREHRCREALNRAVTALEHDSSAKLRALMSEAVRCEVVIGEVARLDGRGGSVTAAGIDATGREAWLGRADGKVDRWQISSQDVDRIEGIVKRVDYLRFASTGDRVALSSHADGWTGLRGRAGEVIGPHLVGSDPTFAPDGQVLATRQTKQVNLYDAATGALEWSAPADGTTTALAFGSSPDELFYTASTRRGSEVTRRSVATGDVLGHLSVPNYVHDIAVSPDHRHLASAAGDNYLRLWDLESASEQAEKTIRVDIRERRDLSFVLYAPDGSSVVTLATAGSIDVIDLERGVSSRRDNVDPSAPPVFSADGRWLLTASADGRASLRDARSGLELARARVEGLSVLSFSPTAEGFVIGSASGAASYWAIDDRDHWRDPARHDRSVQALAFSPTSPWRLASASSAGMVRVWTVEAPAERPVAWRREGATMALAFSADGARLTSLSNQGNMQSWALDAAAEPEPVPRACASRRIAASRSGARLALACPDGVIQIWDPAQQRLMTETSTKLGVTALAVSDRGDRVLLGGSAGAVESLTIGPDKEIQTHRVTGHRGGTAVTAVAFRADRGGFVSGGNDGFVRLWTSANADHVVEMSIGDRNVQAVAVSTEPALIAAGDDADGSISVWNAEGDETFSIEGACAGHVTALQFSPDGQLLGVGCSDGQVHAWPIGLRAQVELACRRLARVSGELGLPKACSRRDD
ncbi:WD domain, G-beta repeat [Enhygromyxa salina]|uniref:WD domain, G-beta repeat n=1 Tax=Enhygromyxa salina TaxID=215803 RepID=A0A2S9YCW2_9BACT|nr:SIR2 family protein [Enhygromyxa salina]PRQ02960.1 WD domain, G-beta repeat [Enhygromyxa salina]